MLISLKIFSFQVWFSVREPRESSKRSIFSLYSWVLNFFVFTIKENSSIYIIFCERLGLSIELTFNLAIANWILGPINLQAKLNLFLDSVELRLKY